MSVFLFVSQDVRGSVKCTSYFITLTFTVFDSGIYFSDIFKGVNP